MNLSIKLLFCCLFTLVSSEEKKILDMRFFTLETTTDWSFDEGKGADSWVGTFIVDNQELFRFDFGMHSGVNLVPISDYYISNDSLFTFEYYKTPENKFKEKYTFYKMRSELDLTGKEFIEFFYYEKINGIQARIVIPAKIGKGVTGVNFKYTKPKEQGLSLSIIGQNLSLEHHNDFIKTLKTLKFKKY